VAGIFGKSLADDSNANLVGSPLKKARPSLGADASVGGGGGDLGGSSSSAGSAGFPPALGDVLAKAQAAQAGQDQDGASAAAQGVKIEEGFGVKMEEEEEL
jgi:hypothetical protein